jgi:predicted permease
VTRWRQRIARLSGLIPSRRRDSELDEEVEAHLEFLAQEHMRRGLSREDAWAAARRAFGGVVQMKETYRDQRGWPMLFEFAQDVRYAVRVLMKSPAFAAVAALTLAVGIGASTAMFSVADSALLNPLPFPDPDRLVTVNEIVPLISERPMRLTAPDLLDYERLSHAFDALGGWTPRSFELSGVRESERVFALRATASLFAVLRVAPAMGRTFSTSDDRQGAKVCVISDGLWRRWFGADRAALGASVHLDRVPYQVIGVMPRTFTFPLPGASSAPAADLWVPMSMTPAELSARGDSWDYNGIARLKQGVAAAQATDDVNAIARHIARDLMPPDRGGVITIRALVQPLAAQVSGTVRPLVLALLGAVLCVLLIACVNVANLLLARGAHREREMAVRAALGASRVRLMRQLVAEALVFAVLAALGGGLYDRCCTTGLAPRNPARCAE